ncbi:hypothetical protein BGZ73_000217 [Actinomortierella ambigua]|nr:hypothetical protein BGZ73_000217 [Actinomortierella ambigua]
MSHQPTIAQKIRRQSKKGLDRVKSELKAFSALSRSRSATKSAPSNSFDAGVLPSSENGAGDPIPDLDTLEKDTTVNIRALSADGNGDSESSDMTLLSSPPFLSSVLDTPVLRSPRETWTNWAGNQTCSPERIFYPITLQELIGIVNQAKKNNKKVRCAGAGHSWSSTAVTDDYLVIMNKMTRVHGARKLSEDDISAASAVIGRPVVSHNSRQPLGTASSSKEHDSQKRDVWAVTFENGILVRDLDNWLRAHDPPLTLPSNVVLDSHGACTHSRTLPDLIHEITIVDADGHLQTFSATDASRADDFSAACVNLGLLGLIYTFTLRCEPMDFQLHASNTFPLLTDYIPLPSKAGITNPFSVSAAADAVIDVLAVSDKADEKADREAGRKLRAIVLNNDQSEFFYWPFNTPGLGAMNDKMWIKQWRRTTAVVTETAHKEDFKEMMQTLQTEFGSKLYEFMVSIPESTPFIQCLMANAAGHASERVQTVPDAIHYQAGIDNILCLDMEMAFKVDDDFVNVVRGWRYVIEQMYALADKKQYPLNLTMEMRFVKSSPALLSNAYDDDPEAIYCMMEILSIKGTKGFDEFSNNIAQYWINNFGARPHWAKMWEHIDGIDEHLQKAYGDRIGRFEAVRKKYDPQGMFMNKTFAKFVSH